MKEARNWNDESYYALNVYEKVLGIIGIWPLNAGELKSIARCSLAILIQVNITEIIINKLMIYTKYIFIKVYLILSLFLFLFLEMVFFNKNT